MMKAIPAFLFGLFCLSSCITVSFVELEVLKPSEKKLPKTISSLAFINRSLINQPDSLLKDSTSLPENSPEYLINLASTEAILGLAAILTENPQAFTIDEDEILETLPNRDFMPLPDFSQDELMEFSDQLKAKGLISLDYFMIDDEPRQETNFALNDGSYLPYFTASITRGITTIWRLYDLENRQLLDEFVITDTLYFFYERSSWDPVTAMNLLLIDTDFVVGTYVSTGFGMSLQFARRIAPYYALEYRPVFSGRALWLRRSYRNTRGGDFSSARRILLEYTRHENPRKAALAYHNLAVLSESAGSYREALLLIDEAANRRNHRIIRKYKRQLTNRIEEIKRLDEQLGL
jgi:hypothetical protein